MECFKGTLPRSASWDGSPSHWGISERRRSKPSVTDSDSKCTVSTDDDSSTFHYWPSSSYSSSTPESRHGRNCTLVNEGVTVTSSTSRSKKRNRNEWDAGDSLDNSAASSQKVHLFDIEMMGSIITPKNLRDHCDKNEGSYWTEPATKHRRRTYTTRYGCFAPSFSTTKEKAETCKDDKISTYMRKILPHEKYKKRVKAVCLLEPLSDDRVTGISVGTPATTLLCQNIDKDETKQSEKNKCATEAPNIYTSTSSEHNVANTDKVVIKINGKCGSYSTWSWIDRDDGNECFISYCEGNENVGAIHTDDISGSDDSTNANKTRGEESNVLNAEKNSPLVPSCMESSTTGINSARYVRNGIVSNNITTDDEANLSDTDLDEDNELDTNTTILIDSNGVASPIGSSNIIKCKSKIGTVDTNLTTVEDPTESRISEDDLLNVENTVSTVSKCIGGTMKKILDHGKKVTHWIEPTESPGNCSKQYASDGITTVRTTKTKANVPIIGSVNHEGDNKIYSSITYDVQKKTEGAKLGGDRKFQNNENTDADFASTTRMSSGLISKHMNDTENNSPNDDDLTTIEKKIQMSKYHSGEKSTECDERGNIRCAKECTTESPTCTTTNYGNKRKIVYQATEGPNRPVYKYALDLISMVCNNSYSYQTDDPVRCAQRDECVNHRYHYQQVHRFLDKPLFERKPDEEPDKERLMRLQLRQRFASATSTGMSPIEFSRKLLKFWGAQLEEIVLDL